jgi:hypothetical protein
MNLEGAIWNGPAVGHRRGKGGPGEAGGYVGMAQARRKAASGPF